MRSVKKPKAISRLEAYIINKVMSDKYIVKRQ